MGLKAVNVFSHVFLMILALCCGGMGGWLISRENWIITVFGISNIQILGYVLIGTAVLLFITAIFGLCGTLIKSKSCMILFLSIISIVFVLLIISGSLLFVYNNQVQDMVSSHLKNEFVVKYGHDEGFTMAWNEIQSKSQCCGIINGADYKSSQWYNKPNSEFPKDGEVPSSCCTRNHDGELLNVTMCFKSRVEDSGPYIYENGCWDKLKLEVSKVLYWTSICIFVLCGILVLIILFGCIMNTVINRNILYGQVV